MAILSAEMPSGISQKGLDRQVEAVNEATLRDGRNLPQMRWGRGWDKYNVIILWYSSLPLSSISFDVFGVFHCPFCRLYYTFYHRRIPFHETKTSE
jgi:hypothetical protein